MSIVSPRKIPILIKIFEKAAGDLSSMNQDFSKDPRHLVLLRGFSFNDRPQTPQTNNTIVNINQNAANANLQSPNNQLAQKDNSAPTNQNNMIRNANSKKRKKKKKIIY